MANAVLTNDLTPVLDWADVSGALEYWAQISADPRFTVIEHEQAGLATSTITPTTNLTDAKKYYWRFRSRTSATLATDQTNVTASAAGSALRDATARTILAQTFTPDKSLPLKRVILSLKRVGTVTGNVWVELWTTSGGGPPSAQSGTDSAVVAVSTIGAGAFENVNFDFTTPISLAAGTVYAITVHGSFAIDGANYCIWEDSGSATYADGAPYVNNGTSWATNGTDDMVFTTQTHSWQQWSPIWSFWLDSTFPTTVTPTGFMLVDPTELADAYTFVAQPDPPKVTEAMVLRGQDRNILGDVLTEYTTQRSTIELTFDDAYIGYVQAAEIQRFAHKRKNVFLVLTDYNGQDTRERVFKVEFAEPPEFVPIAPGRHDYFRGSATFIEAQLD